jgi:hypothetical protein
MFVGGALRVSARKGAPESISRQIRKRLGRANFDNMQLHSGHSTKPSATCFLELPIPEP